MSEITNPDDGVSRPSPQRIAPEAHGQAALLLSESMLHALVEANVLTITQALGVVRTAREVSVDTASEIGELEGRTQQALSLLRAIEQSLVTDQRGADAADCG